MKRIQRRFKRLAGGAVRWAERILPVYVLIVLLLPIAAVRATYEWLNRTYFSSTSPKRRKLLAAIKKHQSRRYSPLRLWTGHLNLCTARFFRLWPDRLRQPHWMNRCRFLGKDQVDSLLASGRPIVLATVHFANLTEIYHWLRAKGYAIAFLQQTGLTWDTWYRDYLENLADATNGLQHVPRRFGPEQTWEARDFLAGGNALIGVAMDQRHRRSIRVRGEVFGLRCMTGGLQLGAVANAVVIPCLIRATWCMRSEIYFGQPVPDELLTSRRNHAQAMEHILRELTPWIIANPEQCAPHLVAAMDLESAADEPAQPMSEAPTSAS